MTEELKVHILKRKDRKNYEMRYVCPATGNQVTKSAQTNIKREAERAAAKWEADLRAGRYASDSRMDWESFRVRWEDAKGPTLRVSTVKCYSATWNAFEFHCKPQKVGDLTAVKVAAFTAALRRTGISEASVARHLRVLKAITRWAWDQGLISRVPKFDMPSLKDTAKMKGRPITGEEFDRLLDAVDRCVGDKSAEHWGTLLRGLWWSGLRLGEALALRWDQTPGGVWVVLDGKSSVLMFDGAAQKNGRAQGAPLAPEAVQLLEPIQKGKGFVFELPGQSRDMPSISRIISHIGDVAGVITDVEKSRTATAHDLRRSFGHRWAKVLMPAALRAVMRHSTVQTTMVYYACQDAEETSKELWDKLGDTLGDTEVSNTESAAAENRRKPLPVK